MKHQPSPYRTFLVSCLVLLLSVFTTTASAVVTLPNLAPGSEYQLIFVTSGTVTATSPDIVVYNSFVNTQASLNPSLPSASWFAVVSTPAIDAVSNAPTYSNIPIYNTAGQLVASGASAFWSASHSAPIEYDQQGALVQSIVWTGTSPAGISANGLANSSDYSQIGVSQTSNESWVADSSAYTQAGLAIPVYALSSPITISAVPEPKTWATLLVLGAMGIAGFVWHRRRHANPAFHTVAGEDESYFEG